MFVNYVTLDKYSFYRILMHVSLIALLTIFTVPALLMAELTNCSGVWTNKSCSVPQTATINEINNSSVKNQHSKEKAELAQKELWLKDLELSSLKLKREHKVSVDYKTASLLCKDPATSLLDCRKAVSAAEKEIEDRKLEIAKLKVQQELIKQDLAQQEIVKQDTVQNKPSSNNQFLILQQNQISTTVKDKDVKHHSYDKHRIERDRTKNLEGKNKVDKFFTLSEIQASRNSTKPKVKQKAEED